MKSEFSKNVIRLSLTTGLSQAIPFLVLPVLQRFFFGPEEFGIYSSFVSIASIWISLASFRYEFAIVTEEDEQERIRLLLVAISLTFITFLVILILGLLPNSLFNNIQGLPNGYLYTFFLSASVLGFSGTQIISYWLNHSKRFKEIGYGKIVQSSVSETTKVLSGLYSLGGSGLIGGRIIGQLSSFAWLIYKILPELRGKISKHLNYSSLKSTFLRHKDYLLYSTPSSVVGTFSNNLHILIPAKLYSNAIVGNIGVAYIYLAVPAGIVSGSFSQVFFKQVSEISKRSELYEFYIKTATRLFFFSLPFAIFIQFIPTDWITSLLGESWAPLMIFARMMIWYILIWFISSALSFIYIRLKVQKKMLILDISRASLNIAALLIAHYLYQDPVITIAFFVVSQIISYIISILAALYFIKTSKLLN